MTKSMRQWAPYPDELADLVAKVTYRPGWTVELADIDRDYAPGDPGREKAIAGGLTLVITTKGYDSYHPERGEHYRVNHYRPVPAATYNRASWRRWLFDQFVAVETHEAMEFFAIDGEHIYAATHGPGDDPYVIHDYAADQQRRTSFRGTVNL